MTEVPDTASSWSERFFGFKTKTMLLSVGGVVLFALYLSRLLFGDASFEVRFKLERYEAHLQSEIMRLKQENASLQKELFELNELEPEE